MIDFDAWRAGYDAMSYLDHLAFYETVWQNYPSQIHFDLAAAQAFLGEIHEPVAVLEIGGWRGELANQLLPWFSNIIAWVNLEICHGAVDHSIPTSPIYRAKVPDDFVWNLDPAWLRTFNVLVASHVIEHMRARELEALMDRLEIDYAYLASPLNFEPVSWAGYNGSHILEIGWDGVIELMARHGLRHRAELDRPDVRVFWRGSDGQA